MKDLFSTQASDYAKYRPHYPQSLYDYIFKHVENFDYAWDCATGNGQAASVLANHFKHVAATDLSENQINHAIQQPNIDYKTCIAEKTPFEDNSFDLVTVAQALHWFDYDRFYPELKRVLKPKGIFAAWGYDLCRINNSIDKVLDQLYCEVLSNYWDPRRKLVDQHYNTIPFPLTKIATPLFEIQVEYDFNSFINMPLKTWSSVQTYIQQHNENPVDALLDDFKTSWGDTSKTKTARYPVFLLLGKNND